jgi:hypothetical protein
MKFKEGDKVKVKSLADIKATLGMDREHCRFTGVYLNPNMHKYCGGVFVVEGVHGDQKISLRDVRDECDWVWSPYWLEKDYSYKIKLDEDLFNV